MYMQTRILNYRIIIEPEQYEDGTTVYNAYCPTLNIADYGDSVKEVLKSIKDGIELAVEELTQKNKEIPVDHIEDQIITFTKVEIQDNISTQI